MTQAFPLGVERRHSRAFGVFPLYSGEQTSTVYDGVDAPPTASMCQSGCVQHHLREASVSEVSIIGLDIAKHVFHVHGADGRGRAMFSKRISRGKLLDFFAAQPSCKVALEACGGAHHWARQLTQLGHEVRLIPPAYVKPFVKRQKNDAIDAEAICEAAQRPSMRVPGREERTAAGSRLSFSNP